MCAGFTGLSDRLKTQKRAVADLNTRLHQINGALDAILSRHDLQTSVRAAAARRRHTVLQERCIGLAAKVQVLRNRGYALSGDEDHLRLKLKSLEASIQDPALSAKEEELWSRLIVIRGYAERLTQEINRPASKDEGHLDEETEMKAKKVCLAVLPLILLSTVNLTELYRCWRTTRSSFYISRRRSRRSRGISNNGRRIGTLPRDESGMSTSYGERLAADARLIDWVMPRGASTHHLVQDQG